MKKLVIATSNQGKFQEITKFFEDIKIELLSLRDFPKMYEVIEDSDTLVGNAVKKASETAKVTQLPSIADDTGLEVDALSGAPGVYSARYAGQNATYADNNNKLLTNLKDIPLEKRAATFKTVMALAFPEGKVLTVSGECHGIILQKLRGQNGFGYDPIFFVPEFDKTFAEMTLNEKNKISHRARALEEMKKQLFNLF